MGNQGTDEKRRINRKKILVKSQSQRLDLKLGERETVTFEVKRDADINQGRLTIEELRRCKGFETVPESEGNEIIESLFQLAIIVYNF
jgi:hypothetical protein